MKRWSRNTWYELYATTWAFTDIHFHFNNKQVWPTLKPPNTLCTTKSDQSLGPLTKIWFELSTVYNKYVDMLCDFCQFVFLLNFLLCLPSVVLWWQGILPALCEKATTDWRTVPKTASFWSSEGYLGKQPTNPEGAQIPDRQHICKVNRALGHLEGL